MKTPVKARVKSHAHIFYHNTFQKASIILSFLQFISNYFTFYFKKHINNAVEGFCEFLKNLTNKAKQIFSSDKNKVSNKNETHKTSTTNVKADVYTKNTVKQYATS
jgi:spore cortex formation protein SpoVR/YcgB (stage V sporulation)